MSLVECIQILVHTDPAAVTGVCVCVCDGNLKPPAYESSKMPSGREGETQNKMPLGENNGETGELCLKPMQVACSL